VWSWGLFVHWTVANNYLYLANDLLTTTTRQTIDKPTNFTNRPTDIWLTKDRSKRTNHVWQSSQPITSRLNWQTTNNIKNSSTNQDNDQRLTTSTDNSQFTQLSWILPLRLSKRQSMPPQTVLPRSTLTQMIILDRLLRQFNAIWNSLWTGSFNSSQATRNISYARTGKWNSSLLRPLPLERFSIECRK